MGSDRHKWDSENGSVLVFFFFFFFFLGFVGMDLVVVDVDGGSGGGSGGRWFGFWICNLDFGFCLGVLSFSMGLGFCLSLGLTFGGGWC